MSLSVAAKRRAVIALNETFEEQEVKSLLEAIDSLGDNLPAATSSTAGAVTTGAAVADVTGTAGATYTATEQAIVNSLVTKVNALLASLRASSVIST